MSARLHEAQRALVAAEAATGLRTHLMPMASRGRTPDPAGDRFLPVPEALAPFVAFGGLRRGCAVRVTGSTSLLLALAAAACRTGAWCAVVGMPDLGLAAATEHGLPTDRLALIPRPGPDGPAVLAAAIDGFDVLLAGPGLRLPARDQRQLATRLRHREAVLLTGGLWPGADLELSVSESRWEGLGQGSGYVAGRDLTLRVEGRGVVGGVGHRVRLRSPDGLRLTRAAVPVAGETGPFRPLHYEVGRRAG